MRVAIRNLSRTPAFTLVVIVTLAVGIGASTAIFSVVNAVLLRPLAYPDPARLVRITSELRTFGATDTGVSGPELADYQARSDLFAGVAGVMPVSANVTSGSTPQRVEMLLVSWNYFTVLGVPAAHGRVFGPQDDTPGVANIAVVSEGFWRRSLSADVHAIGTTIVIDGDRVQVVGVMPVGFRHPGRTLQGDVDIWSPAGFRAAPGGPAPSRARRRLEGALARLQPTVALPVAQDRLQEHGSAMTRQYPADYPAEDGWRPRLVPLQEDIVGNVSTPMWTLLAGVGLLLLVACVNVAHLVLARSSARQQEMAIRQALGASAVRVTRQLVSESAVLAAAGGGLALLVASWGLRGLLALAPARVPRIADVRLDAPAILVAFALAACVTLVFGLLPAWQARRIDTFAVLKADGPGRSADRRGRRARDLLVGAEVGMATVLLIGAGLLVRSVLGLLAVPVGFDTDDLVTARIALPRPNDAARAAYLDPARRVAFSREALRRVAALPGVEHAAMSTQVPLGGFNPPLFIETAAQATADAGRRPVVQHFQVSSGYFATLGIGVVRGRVFTDSDTAGAEPVAVVSETAARLLWPGRDAVGERVRFSPDAPWITVIGVTGDVLTRRLTEPPPPIVYRPLEQSSDLALALLVRARGDAPQLGEQLAREIRAIDPDLPVYAVRTMEDLIGAAVAQRQFLMRLLIVFAVLATALAVLGIYGVMAYTVAQRTREIGIRIAIGASRGDVARMILRRGLAVTIVGAVAGLLVSAALSGLIRSQLFGVEPSDPLTAASVLALMLAVAAAAAYLPAQRAARVEPIVALRTS